MTEQQIHDDSAAPIRPSSRNKWFAVGALAIALVAFLVITVSGIGQNLVYYWTPSDLENNKQKSIGATIRLGGMVVPGSIVGGKQGSQLEFDVSDYKATVHVKSAGVPPQMFRENIGVVVEGTMTADGFFKCNRLMVSHGNEYRAPKNGEHPDVKTLIKSTEGLD
jgi:cytochrome c-type biogenesis protein CcmE